MSKSSRRHKKNRENTAIEQQSASEVNADPTSQGMVAHAELSVSHTSGPIPPPGMLAEYEAIVSGSAARIFQMAEDQSKHRQSLEAQVIKNDIARSKGGLWAGFIVAMTAILGGVYVAINGYPGAGGTIATASVIGW